MLVDAAADVSADLDAIEAAAVAAENANYDGFAVAESRHDVFTSLTLGARATQRIGLQSAIAVAFARNPMSVAISANDVQLVARGRFQLGLGSQIKPHIERRFAMPWGQPAVRMEEFLAAVRAIWAAWATGDRLHFRGQFYQHTLMTEFFNPGPNPYGNPPIWLGAVGERMAGVAGRVADGILCHPFTTAAYLRERTLPVVKAARTSLDGFEQVLSVLTVLGNSPEERAAADKAVRRQVAFYGSTPAYRAVLELHGWGGLHERLNELSRQHAWDEAANAINDDVLDAFAVAGTPQQVATALRERFDGSITRISLYTPYRTEPAQVRAAVDNLRAQR